MPVLNDWICAAFVISIISSVAVIDASINEIVEMLNSENSGLSEQYEEPSDIIPSKIDWRKCTPHVRNQGSECSASYAFSVIGALECAIWRRTSENYQLSVQDIIDCGPLSASGCNGGTIEGAFMYIRGSSFTKEETHPYSAVKGDCLKGKKCFNMEWLSYYRVKSGDEEELKHALAHHGAISATIHTTSTFHQYRGGIFNDTSCSNEIKKGHHSILIVGYDIHNGQKYWLIKNSWGTNWGEGGYMRMARDANNMCGIASNAIYLVLN